MVLHVLLALWISMSAVSGERYSDKGRLIHDIFRNYTPENRPVMNSSTTTQLNVSFHLRMVHQLDERHQKFVTTGWFTFQWFDEMLTWDPRDYGNLSSITAAGIWKPDVMIYNGYNEFLDLAASNVKGIISSDGKIIWAPADLFQTHCPVDITFYPFDTQTCSLQIISWTNNKDQLDLVSANRTVSMESYITNVEWEIEKTTAERVVLTYDSYPGLYPTVLFNITLARRRIFFLMNILVPAISESLLCNLVFLVPSESGERMSLSITVLLSYAVFLGVTIESLPRSSVNVSIMSLYMLVVLILGTVSVLLTGVSLYIYHLPGPLRLRRCKHHRLEKSATEDKEKCAGGEDLSNGDCCGTGEAGGDYSLSNLGMMSEDPREQSRQFDRFCLKVILTLTILSAVCLLLLLTWHD